MKSESKPSSCHLVSCLKHLHGVKAASLGTLPPLPCEGTVGVWGPIPPSFIYRLGEILASPSWHHCKDWVRKSKYWE